MTRRLRLLSVFVSAVFLVAGCAQDPGALEASPRPTADSTSSPITQADLDKEFRTIVDASCDRAYEVGVTESMVGSDTRLVLVPQAQAYNDFTAAAVSDDVGLTPIWSTEDFGVCIDSINFSMSEDGGSVYAITVSGDLAAGQLRSEYSVEDYGVFITDYLVVDGLISEVTSTTPDSTTTKIIRYGMPSEVDLKHFRDAIDEFLASE